MGFLIAVYKLHIREGHRQEPSTCACQGMSHIIAGLRGHRGVLGVGRSQAVGLDVCPKGVAA